MKTIIDFISLLQQTESQLELVMKQRNSIGVFLPVISDFTFIFDAKMECVYSSPYGAEYLGLVSEQTDIRGCVKNGLWPDSESFRQDAINVFMNGSVIGGEKTISRPTSLGIAHFEYSISPLYVENGDIEAIICKVRDITERWRFEVKNRHLLCKYQNEAEKVKKLIEYIPISTVVVDRQGVITRVSNSTYDIIPPLQGIELIGRHYIDIFGPYFPDLEDIPIIKVLRTGKPIKQYIKHQNWSGFITAFPITNYSSGHLEGGVSICLDITQYEQQRQDAIRQDRLRLVSEMAAGVAHEIRNPMTVIKGYLQYLQRQVPSEMYARFNLILGEVDHVEQLVTDFLSLAKNRTSETILHNLNNIVQNLADLISANAIENNVDVVTNLQDDLPLVKINPDEVRQLILNLVRNGIEAMNGDDFGVLEIDTFSDDKSVALSVSDTGCGISKELLEKIFYPFYTSKPTGTGLGLPICASIMERHGGRIHISSSSNGGTRVTATFPIP